MKILPYIFLIILCGSGFVFLQKGSVAESEEDYEYFRIHIVANSNSTFDQEMKFKVKGAVVEYLTPYIAESDSESKCKEIISSKQNILKSVVDNELKSCGANYAGKVQLTRKKFPTRYYDNFVLEEGEYDCVYIELGEAKGDNWWCVVYPPLCFVNKNKSQEQDIIYQSKIAEIIKRYF